MEKLVYGYYECLNLGEILSLINEEKVNETMKSNGEFKEV